MRVITWKVEEEWDERLKAHIQQIAEEWAVPRGNS
jgi:hypothetical protein